MSTTDREGIIRSFNVGAEHMLGYRAGELVGKVSPSCFHEEQECRQRARTLSIELGKPVEPGIDVLIAKARRGHVDEQEWTRSEEHTSELQSLMRIPYAAFCLKK